MTADPFLKTQRGYRQLTEKLTRVLPETFVSVDVWNPLHVHEMLQLIARCSVPDLAITGGFLARILGATRWPSGNYRIWVACRGARELLCHVTGAPRTRIGVLPRFLLFPPSQKPKPFPKDDFTLVYGGRLAPFKGIWQLIEMTSALQCTHGLSAKLILSGAWSEGNLGYFASRMLSAKEAERRTLRLIERLPWKERPTIITGAGPSDWMRLKAKQPVFASLSRLSHDDFGVSLAQAQELGWPALLSGWGPHWDAKASNVLYVPEFSLFTDAKTRLAQSRELAAFVAQKIRSPSRAQARRPLRSRPLLELTPPKTMSERELIRWQTHAESRYPGILKSAQKGFPDFGKTASGRRFIADYQRIFGCDGSF